MGKRDPRVDAYIAKAGDFAKPILNQLREAVHTSCPDVAEAMKWSFPHFMYKGILCSMASFKEHAAFGFWKGSLVLGGRVKDAGAMGQFGCITKVSDLPSKNVLAGYIKKAAALNDEGVKVEGALKKNTQARVAFEGFSSSHKREYVEWITEAKSDATRARRLQTAIEWMAEGKPRNWKYMRM